MREQQKVSREDWNYVYGQILDLLDMEHVVTKMEFLVVDVMEAENQNVIITNKGEFCTVLPASYFKQWNGYEGYCCLLYTSVHWKLPETPEYHMWKQYPLTAFLQVWSRRQ